MAGFLTVIHVFISIFLVISILLQSSKGGGLAGMFGGGGGGMGSVFGGRGAASFLAKVTMWLGIAFAITSITIALLSKGVSSGQRSMIQQVAEQEASSPAAMLPTVSGTGEESFQDVPIESEEPVQ